VADCPVRLLDEQSGSLPGGTPRRAEHGKTGTGASFVLGGAHDGFGDQGGGASRFFYCAKVSRAERNAGLDGFDTRPLNWSSDEQNPGSFQAEGTDRSARNHHPTVKPIALMRWLVLLVTPPGGVILDPFLGSGTTGIAAALEGFDFLGIEREAGYMRIAEARMAFWAEHGEDGLRIVKERDAAEQRRQEKREAGQLDLLTEAP
jgi:site-specific DNA-methyltransferase (adenine-specific)